LAGIWVPITTCTNTIHSVTLCCASAIAGDDMSSAFNLSTVFRTIASAVPEQEFLVWRDRRLTYAAIDARVEGVARFLATVGLGCHTERADLANHESGQDHLGLYLRNSNEYLEAMIGAYRARVAPFNVNYRYVDDELSYLLNDAKARALVYHAQFAPQVAAIRDRLPHLRTLIQVADDSKHELLSGAVDYESMLSTPEPPGGLPIPSPDDLYILYTGGTTGMPKGVLWRQHDIFISAMGGRPFGSDTAHESYDHVVAQAHASAGAMSILMIPPLMHGAAQWAAFHTVTMGGRIVLPDDVDRFCPDAVLALAQREKVLSITTVGDAVARPLVDALEAGDYDLSALVTVSNGGAAISDGVRDRLQVALPHIVIVDGVGASESGMQMSTISTAGSPHRQAGKFTPQSDTAVIAEDFSRILGPGEGQGWLARRDFVPLGYLGDAAKTARTFPVLQQTRWSVPGDRATALPDGRIELLGRDSVTINSGGEKIFAEEVERAVADHPDIYDVVVVGRPSTRWGSEVVAVIQTAPGSQPTDEELIQCCANRLARYKIPKAFIRTQKVVRSPAGKADYRWAKQLAIQNAAKTADSTRR
jgi:acyl-CoA synthetase (AMP-forming)/AMP-acid ligase II